MYKKYPYLVEVQPTGVIELSNNTESCHCYYEVVGGTIPFSFRYKRLVGEAYFYKDGRILVCGRRLFSKVLNKNFSLRLLENRTFRFSPSDKEGPFYV